MYTQQQRRPSATQEKQRSLDERTPLLSSTTGSSTPASSSASMIQTLITTSEPIAVSSSVDTIKAETLVDIPTGQTFNGPFSTEVYSTAQQKEEIGQPYTASPYAYPIPEDSQQYFLPES